MMPVGVQGAELVLPPTPRGIDERRRLSGKSPLEVAREFEALLVAQMIAAMRRTVGSGGLLAASGAHRMLDGAFDHEVARSVAARGDFAIAPQLMVQLARQGIVPSAASTAAEANPPAAVPMSATSVPAGATGPAPARVPGGAAALPAATARVQATATTSLVEGGAPDARVAAGAMVPPVDGPITSAFGVRRDPLSGAERFHAGVDFAVPRGASIRAVAPGTVVFSGWRGAGGNVVEVRHAGGLRTSYAHAERTLVAVGDQVAAGDVLATVGSSGRSTGPHLHFTVRRHGQAIDPARFFGQAPVAVAAPLEPGRES